MGTFMPGACLYPTAPPSTRGCPHRPSHSLENRDKCSPSRQKDPSLAGSTRPLALPPPAPPLHRRPTRPIHHTLHSRRRPKPISLSPPPPPASPPADARVPRPAPRAPHPAKARGPGPEGPQGRPAVVVGGTGGPQQRRPPGSPRGSPPRPAPPRPAPSRPAPPRPVPPRPAPSRPRLSSAAAQATW